MTSEPRRDPVTDALLTPQNSALVVIDYQPSQVQTVASIDHDVLTRNIVSVARIAKTYGVPIVLSTVNVANGQGPTIPELKEVLSDSVEIDRTQINSWEDTDFRRAVEATGRKKLIMTALWTEVCLGFPDGRRAPRRLRSVPGRRCSGRDIPGGAPGRPGTHRPGRRTTHRLGIPGLRIATRLGSHGHRARRCGHRAHHSLARRRLNGPSSALAVRPTRPRGGQQPRPRLLRLRERPWHRWNRRSDAGRSRGEYARRS
jgi:hypothetical protein